LHDLGHAFKEAEITLSMKLPKFPGRQYDPFSTVKDFTTMVKIKVFSNEEDVFDDIFLHKNTSAEVKHVAQLLFVCEDHETFYEYKERRLTKVPLDQLLIEPITKPTPIVSIEGDSKENSKTDSGEESQEKSTRESEKSSRNGKRRRTESKKDTTQYTKNTIEQTSASKQAKIHATSTQLIKTLVIDLEEEWDNFNKRLQIEEQTLELRSPQ